MREPKKWSMAYDDGGHRYEFETSNMAKSFSSVLKGIRALSIQCYRIIHLLQTGCMVQ
jgi:hypothetical protein